MINVQIFRENIKITNKLYLQKFKKMLYKVNDFLIYRFHACWWKIMYKETGRVTDKQIDLIILKANPKTIWNLSSNFKYSSVAFSLFMCNKRKSEKRNK